MPRIATQMKHPHVAVSKRHCGGSPVIAGTKFPVRSVVNYVLLQGMTPEELVREFSHLSLSQVYDALSYYYDNRSEIDRELEDLTEAGLKRSEPR